MIFVVELQLHKRIFHSKIGKGKHKRSGNLERNFQFVHLTFHGNEPVCFSLGSSHPSACSSVSHINMVTVFLVSVSVSVSVSVYFPIFTSYRWIVTAISDGSASGFVLSSGVKRNVFSFIYFFVLGYSSVIF